MYIELTEPAIEQLQKHSLDARDRIRLLYDAEGCGCAVSGVIALWIVNTAEDDEIRTNTNITSLPLYHLKRHEIFLEDQLRLHYLPERLAFRLSSKGQIYSSHIVLSDHR